jgi:endonuclease YncB( thermonuclease family)
MLAPSFSLAAVEADAPLRAPATLHALSGAEFTLGDNRNVRLEAVAAPMPETPELAEAARAALDKLVAGKEVELENVSTDRYGRLAAEAYVAGDGARTSLQVEMLRAGLIFVYPITGDEPNLDALFAAEKEARAAARGIWANPFYADTPAGKAWPKLGHFAFVSGKVLSAERVKDKIYLRFGEDWRKDFTAAIAAHDLAAFRHANVDPLAYAGKTIRVRGWVERDGGTAMMVNAPAQIEILG